MADKSNDPKLWTPRSVDDTKALYADWASSYEDDVTAMAYATPDRIARALLAQTPDRSQPVLDFGCGTGLSGEALFRKGFTTLDGTDITPEMLALARTKTTSQGNLYRKLWQGTPGDVAASPGDYNIIVATGVISLGAAPPEMLGVLLAALAPGGLFAFSYNDPTLEDSSYTDALQSVLDNGTAEQVFREHGPHLSEKVTGSDVIVLRRL